MRHLVLTSLILLARIAVAAPFPTEPTAAHRAIDDLVAHPDLSALSAELGSERPFAADSYRKLFLAMWAQVPNWKSGDPLWAKRVEPPWTPPPREPGKPRAHRPPPHDPDKLDWIEALIGLDLQQLGEPFAFQEMPKVELPPVPDESRAALRADALKVVAEMHALASTHRAEAVLPMFKLAFTLDGVFRDECGRQIRAIGDAAVAPLVRLQYERGVPGAPLAKQRRYAVYQLDRMDRARPSKAITTAPDDRLRAELIHVYGDVRAPDAVEPILDQIDAQSHRVRREALWAFRRYVEGAPPPPAPKRKRRLPGGKEESEEKPDYLTYREVAELALGKRLDELELTMPQPHPTALQMFEAIVAHDDAERAAEWERAWEVARQRADAGDNAGAVSDYEWILAHDPTTAKRAEMAPAFAQLAEALRRVGKLDEAAATYWKAASLAAPDAEARRLSAEASFLDAERAKRSGRQDEAALRRAIELVPGHPGATERLSEIVASRSKRRNERLLLACVVFGAMLVVGGWMLLRPRRT